MKLGIDLDDTLANVSNPYYYLFGKNHGLSDINWTMADLDISNKQYIKESDNLWRYGRDLITPTEIEVEKLFKGLNEKYDQVDIVTCRQDREEEMKAWLDEYNIEYSNFISDTDKHNRQYDLFVDDSPDIIRKMDNCVAYSQKWNRNMYVKRISSLWNLLNDEEIEKDILWGNRNGSK